jgi:UDP-N-acetylmuramoyl-tripeptide--D-alanyl-D-alanine ligase
MRYRWSDIPALLRTPIGRSQFLSGVHYRAWPLLSRIAGLHRRTLVRNTRIVAVVGSFGKTTTARAAAAALGVRVHPDIELNEWRFVARAVLRIRPHDSHGVIEVGIGGKGQMESFARMIKPDGAIVTSIGSEHHRSLHTLETTRAEKAEMVRILPPSGFAVLNGDDPNVCWMAQQTRANVVKFGFGERNEIRTTNVALDWPHGTRFRLHADGTTRDLRIRLFGRHMVYPILAAVAAAFVEGFSIDRIASALETLPPAPGRLEMVRLENGVFLGEVSEPPGSQGPIYRHLGKRIAEISSRAIFVGGNFQRYAAGATKSGLSRDALVDAGRSVLKAIEVLRHDLEPGDVILIKGRDTQRLDRIALALSGRKVRCDIAFCNAMPVRCHRCPMLESGWGNLRVVI